MDLEVEELIKEMIYSSPLPLLSIKDKEVIDYVNNFLPYSTGFEIECNYGKDFNKENFENIPDIVHVQVDRGEQRYRIPNGLKGIVCLYNICEQLKLNSEENPLSGIHYHVDMTDVVWEDVDDDFCKKNKNWIVKELDSWEYKGEYNKRDVSKGGTTWLRFSRHQTAEFRCGEMTFAYIELVRTIIHANNIVKKIKELLLYDKERDFKTKELPPVIYTEIDYPKILNYVIACNQSINDTELMLLNQEIEALDNKPKQNFEANESYKEIINKRIIKIGENGR
jgi:hypothetical protein